MGITVHHSKQHGEKLDSPELMFDLDNGITLCVDCHANKHKGEPCYSMLKAKALNRSVTNSST
jgi:hypothetical protein